MKTTIRNVSSRLAFIGLLIGLLSACGGDSDTQERATALESAPGYSVGADARQDPHNYYPYFKDKQGFCKVNDALQQQCEGSDNGSVTQLNEGPGFFGFTFGLKSNPIQYIDIDPDIDESIFTYSGATATYTAKHYPVAVEQGDYTYFVFSGPVLLDGTDTVVTTSKGGKTDTSRTFLRSSDGKSNALGIYVARYNHRTGKVSKPLLIHSKHTDDPHDNAVLNFDERGNLFILISGRSLIRSALLYFIEDPNSLSIFNAENVAIKDISPDNVNYSQYSNDTFTAPDYAGITYPKLLRVDGGFRVLYTLYCLKNAGETCNGTRQLWSAKLSYDASHAENAQLTEIKPLSVFGGHYATAWASETGEDIVVAFNVLSNENSADRTNLYVLASRDSGQTWSSMVNGVHSESVADILPIDSESELNKVAALNLHRYSDPIHLRMYIKDIFVKEENGRLFPHILSVSASGFSGHSPTTKDVHNLVVTSLTNDGWYTRGVTKEVDHNYSSGFLTSTAETGVRVFFPATPENNNNALAGGAAAYLDIDSPTASVNYLNKLDTVGQPGYVSQLCEMNYMRSVLYQRRAEFAGLASAANPYQFTADSSNPNLAASPLFIVSSKGDLYKLPMTLSEADALEEFALTPVSRDVTLNCDSSNE